MPVVDAPRIKLTGSMPAITVSVVTGSGGGGAVDSVNGKVGTVVLDAADVGALPDTTVIPDVDGLVETTDPRLSDSRAPSGGAGGVLSGSYPNPGFAVDMVEQSELGAYQARSEKDAANGYAGLDADGHVATSTLPALALVEVFEVESQSAMLDLVAQPGDVAVRSDLPATFILTGDPSVLGDWVQLASPTDAVLSVNGQTGVVNLNAANVGADVAGAAAAAQSAAVQRANHTGTQAQSTVTNLTTDLAAKAPMSSAVVVVNAGSNLSTSRPSGYASVFWLFSSGVNVGSAGANIVNAQFGDLWAVAT